MAILAFAFILLVYGEANKNALLPVPCRRFSCSVYQFWVASFFLRFGWCYILHDNEDDT